MLLLLFFYYFEAISVYSTFLHLFPEVGMDGQTEDHSQNVLQTCRHFNLGLSIKRRNLMSFTILRFRKFNF